MSYHNTIYLSKILPFAILNNKMKLLTSFYSFLIAFHTPIPQPPHKFLEHHPSFSFLNFPTITRFHKDYLLVASLRLHLPSSAFPHPSHLCFYLNILQPSHWMRIFVQVTIYPHKVPLNHFEPQPHHCMDNKHGQTSLTNNH